MPREWQDGNPWQRPPSHPLSLSEMPSLSFFLLFKPFSRLLFLFRPLFYLCPWVCFWLASHHFFPHARELRLCACVYCMCVSIHELLNVCIAFLFEVVSEFMKSVYLQHSDKYRCHCISEQGMNRTHRLTWWNFWAIYSIRTKVNDVEVVHSPLTMSSIDKGWRNLSQNGGDHWHNMPFNKAPHDTVSMLNAMSRPTWIVWSAFLVKRNCI